MESSRTGRLPGPACRWRHRSRSRPLNSPTAFFLGVTSRICMVTPCWINAPRIAELVIRRRDRDGAVLARRALRRQIARDHFLLDGVIPGKAQSLVSDLSQPGDLAQRPSICRAFRAWAAWRRYPLPSAARAGSLAGTWVASTYLSTIARLVSASASLDAAYTRGFGSARKHKQTPRVAVRRRNEIVLVPALTWHACHSIVSGFGGYLFDDYSRIKDSARRQAPN